MQSGDAKVLTNSPLATGGRAAVTARLHSRSTRVTFPFRITTEDLESNSRLQTCERVLIFEKYGMPAANWTVVSRPVDGRVS